MNKKLKQAIKQSFTPPPTQKMDEFINSIRYPRAKLSQVIISQIGFIRKRVWIFSILSIFLAFFYTYLANTPENIISGVSAILPLFSLCLITEFYKSRAYNMEETELACKYNLTKITLMRILILGVISFIILLFFIIIANKNDYGAIRNTVYISVPFLFSSFISLVVITKFHSKDAIYVCSAVSGVISLFMLLENNILRVIYNESFIFLWVMSFAILLGLLFNSLIKFIKSQEDLQWNYL